MTPQRVRARHWISVIAAIVLAGGAAYVWQHRAGVKYRLAAFGLRIAHPFVRDLTAPLRAQVAEQTAQIATLREDIARLHDDLARTAKEVARLQPPPTEAAPPPAVPELSPLMGPIDEISLYSKPGRVEIYGAALQQVRSGPVIVKESILRITHQQALLAWWPQYTPAAEATHLRVRASRGTPQGTLKVVLRFADGYSHGFVAPYGAAMPKPDPALPAALVAEDLAAWLKTTSPQTALVKIPSSDKLVDEWVAALPKAVTQRLRHLGSQAISQWAVEVDDAANSAVRLREIALAAPASSRRSTAKLAGKIVGYPLPPGSKVWMTAASGRTHATLLSASNTFTFLDVPIGEPVSIRYRLNEQDYFAQQGRWLVAAEDRGDVDIHLDPPYFNADGHVADPKKAIFVSRVHPGKVPSFYEPHVRLYWPGTSKPQAYDSYTFTNNWGYLDRDRFFDNPGHCLRIVHLGSSHSEAVQVPIGVKYNELMEEELGVRLGRCVEVISAGRDNGDIGSNYPRITDYALHFKPDIVLLENSSTLIMQLQPKLLKMGWGWDHQRSPLDHFEYEDGKLAFHTIDANAAIHTTKPEQVPLRPGLAFFDTLKAPWDEMPEEGRDAFRYMGDIVNYFRAHHPQLRFILHNGLDQAQCITLCRDRPLKLADGAIIMVGVETLRRNLARACHDFGLECLDLPFPPDAANPEKRLIWHQDGHYNIRGHQWLAHHLSALLAAKLEHGGRPE